MGPLEWEEGRTHGEGGGDAPGEGGFGQRRWEGERARQGSGGEEAEGGGTQAGAQDLSRWVGGEKEVR